MIMESPKQEIGTRSLQPTTMPLAATDFKTRLNFHRESANMRRPRNTTTTKPVIRRFDIQQGK
jgi:hypothetical protein